MSTFDALTLALEEWFNTPLCDLPDPLRKRVEQEFFPMPWDKLAPDQRRSVALQLDYQHDPATEQDQKFWWDFFKRVDILKKQVVEWETVATPTAAELGLKETRLAELKQELARLDSQQRLARGDYYPDRKPPIGNADAALADSAQPVRYIAYPKAMSQLTARLGATPEELAAWVWFGPKDGGITAYVNANELNPPPRFYYTAGSENQDYVEPLMSCWFAQGDIECFQPANRYISGSQLIDRWSGQPGLHAVAFIHAKIRESRLSDFHPIYGGTRATFVEQPDWPPLESGLFELSKVEEIEAEDFEDLGPVENPPSPAQQVKHRADSELQVLPDATEATNPKGSTVRRDARKLSTQAIYKQWQRAYRAVNKARPNMSDVWYSQHIAKMEIAKGRDAETIRKHMKP